MATKNAADFLLLEDVVGERLTRGERYKKITVNKGALLRAASLSSSATEAFSVSKAGEPRTNIKYKGTTLKISGAGRENSKVALLSEVEYRLLKGVAGDSARYEVYTSGRLKLSTGEEMFVELANVREPITAVLRWRGVVCRGGIGSVVPGFHRFGDKELKFGIEIVVSNIYFYTFNI
jgi:hypothetical protein